MDGSRLDTWTRPDAGSGSPSMMLALVWAVCVVCGMAAEQPPRFQAETRLVVLNVAVTDGHGALVMDLDRAAFRVYEDGRPQRIALFRRDDVPVSLGLVIDNSASMRSSRAAVEAAALAFVRASNALDDLFVLNFADEPHIDVPFTTDRRALEAGVARVDSIGGTALRDAILEAERYVRANASHERRALLVITDARDTASVVSTAQLRRVVAGSGAVLHAVSIAHEAQRAATGSGSDELEHLAELTGGVLYHVTAASDVEATMLEIARRLRNVYTIGYTPTNQAVDGSYRAVRVTVTRRGLTARTRPGYWAAPAR
jgi:Ca-activated chloride channel homolog